MAISKKMSVGKIIKKEMAHGKPQRQAVAIALDVKGKKKPNTPKKKKKTMIA